MNKCIATSWNVQSHTSDLGTRGGPEPQGLSKEPQETAVVVAWGHATEPIELSYREVRSDFRHI